LGKTSTCIAKVHSLQKAKQGESVIYEDEEYYIVSINHTIDITGKVRFYTYYISRSQGTV
jgi:hypothetical protein